MENRKTITESEASSLTEEANIALKKKMQEVIVQHTLLTEQAADIDMDGDIGELTGRRSMAGVTVKQFLDIYNDPNFTTTEEIGAHFNTSHKTVERVARDIMRDYPGLIRTQKRQKAHKVHPGTGSGRSMKTSDVAPRGRGLDQMAPVFPGEVYTDETKIPPRRWDKWNIFQKKRSVAPVRSIGIRPIVFDKVFLFGFVFEDQPNIFYELWYNAYNATFTIHDRYGYEASERFSTMNAAIDAFVDLIGSFGDSQMGDRMRQNITRFADRAAADSIEKAATDSDRIDREWTRQMHKESVEIEKDTLLEQQVQTRGMLAQIVSEQLVQEYHVSRVRRHDAKQFWQAWGRDVEFPSKYMNRGGRGPLKIFSSEAEATFSVGLTLMDRIDVEIWFINRDDRSPPGYYVFNLTSGKIVGKQIRRFRDAYFLAARTLAAKTDGMN